MKYLVTFAYKTGMPGRYGNGYDHIVVDNVFEWVLTQDVVLINYLPITEEQAEQWEHK